MIGQVLQAIGLWYVIAVGTIGLVIICREARRYLERLDRAEHEGPTGGPWSAK